MNRLCSCSKVRPSSSIKAKALSFSFSSSSHSFSLFSEASKSFPFPSPSSRLFSFSSNKLHLFKIPESKSNYFPSLFTSSSNPFKPNPFPSPSNPTPNSSTSPNTNTNENPNPNSNANTSPLDSAFSSSPSPFGGSGLPAGFPDINELSFDDDDDEPLPPGFVNVFSIPNDNTRSEQEKLILRNRLKQHTPSDDKPKIYDNTRLNLCQINSVTLEGFGLSDSVIFEGSIFITAATCLLWKVNTWNQVTPNNVIPLLSVLTPKPELVIFGTGATCLPVQPDLAASLNELGVAYEFFDSLNAAQVFNIVTDEKRKVVAFMVLPDPADLIKRLPPHATRQGAPPKIVRSQN